MADNNLKIWQNNLLANPFHMVDAKFDLVLRLISHGNPAMPFKTFLCYKGNVKFDDIYDVFEYRYLNIAKIVLKFLTFFLIL